MEGLLLLLLLQEEPVAPTTSREDPWGDLEQDHQKMYKKGEKEIRKLTCKQNTKLLCPANTTM